MTAKKSKNQDSLKDLLPVRQFRRIESAFRKHSRLGIETLDTDGNEIKGLCSSDCHSEFCKLVRRSKGGAKRCLQDRLRSLSIAFERLASHIFRSATQV